MFCDEPIIKVYMGHSEGYDPNHFYLSVKVYNSSSA